MSQATGTAANIQVVMQPEEVNFLTEKLDLDKLLKSVSRHTKVALDALVKLLESKDEKIRLTASTKLLELQVSLAKEISADQLQRLIAQARLAGPAKRGVLIDEDEQNKRPLVDFNTIRQV